jgi:hypothetical protein
MIAHPLMVKFFAGACSANSGGSWKEADFARFASEAELDEAEDILDRICGSLGLRMAFQLGLGADDGDEIWVQSEHMMEEVKQALPWILLDRIY